MRVLDEEPNDQEPWETWFHSEQSIPQEKKVNFVYTLSFIYLLNRLLTVEAFKISLDWGYFSWLSELIL